MNILRIDNISLIDRESCNPLLGKYSCIFLVNLISDELYLFSKGEKNGSIPEHELWIKTS